MMPFKDRLSDDAITGVIASFKSRWSDEHRRRYAHHLVPRTAKPVESSGAVVDIRAILRPGTQI